MIVVIGQPGMKKNSLVYSKLSVSIKGVRVSCLNSKKGIFAAHIHQALKKNQG